MTSKKWLLLTLLALVIVVLVVINRGSIASALLPRGMVNMMAADGIADLGDGMHLALCGAGGPMPSESRSGPCVAIIVNEKMFVVDAGTNGGRNLGRMRLNTGQIEAVLLTHFHSDHIDGLGELAMLRWITGTNNSPLTVLGPPGVSTVVDGFNKAYSQDAIHRFDHHGTEVADLNGSGMMPRKFSVPEEGEKAVVYNRDGLLIEAFSVNHAPISPAVGYLFNYKGRSILISGDTTKNSNVELFSQDVDLLVHEALSPKLLQMMSDAAKKAGNISASKIFYDVLDYHASPVEAAEIARDAKAKHLLYYHIVPPLDIPGLDAIWLEGVDEVYKDYTLGADGTLISLPENSSDIIVVKKSL